MSIWHSSRRHQLRPPTGDDKAASLINLYNALTVRTILENYPTDSIQSLAKPFDAKRLKVGGKEVSLNDIEHGALRPLIGYRAHAVLVCAARSCPPLQRFAYRKDKLNAQIDTAYLAWLGRDDLNRFLPDREKGRNFQHLQLVQRGLREGRWHEEHSRETCP